MFLSLLYLLLKAHIGKKNVVTVDTEYTGYEGLIKNRVMALLKKDGIEVSADQIDFRRVGKKSPARDLANKVRLKKVKADQIVTAKELVRL